VADDVIEREHQASKPFQARTHHPQVAAVEVGPPEWEHVPDADGQQKETIQVRVDRRNGCRHREEGLEEVAPEEHSDAESDVVGPRHGSHERERSKVRRVIGHRVGIVA
jgi:hypothetical protein